MPTNDTSMESEEGTQGWKLFASVLVGALVGLAVARFLLFSRVEALGWSLFWEGISQGRMMKPSVVLESTTFWKSFAGVVTGGVLGGMLSRF